MSTQADVVKKSNLKLKVVRGKNASSTPAVQGVSLRDLIFYSIPPLVSLPYMYMVNRDRLSLIDTLAT